MEFESALQDLIKLIEGVAPDLWEIVLRQVWANALVNALVSLVVSAIATVFFKAGKSFRLASESAFADEAWDTAYENYLLFIIPSWVIYLIAVILFLSSVVTRVINPEYYAIELLLEMAGVR